MAAVSDAPRSSGRFSRPLQRPIQPLHVPAAGTRLEVACLLVAAGAGDNARQAGGCTLLVAAVQNGDAPLPLLREAGAVDAIG